MWSHFKGTLELPQVQDTPTATSDRPSDEDSGGQAIRLVAVHSPETRQTDDTPQLVDLSGDVEIRQRESIHEAVARAGSERYQAVGLGYQGIAQGIQATVGDDGGRGSGTPTERGSPPPLQSLEEDVEVVHKSGRPRPAACSNHT